MKFVTEEGFDPSIYFPDHWKDLPKRRTAGFDIAVPVIDELHEMRHRLQELQPSF